MSKIFKGYVNEVAWTVLVDRDELDPRLEHCDHSPNGFAWGYRGSGPAQLAFAMLCETFDDVDFARKHYQEFKREVIAKLDIDSNWTMTDDQVKEWCLKSKLEN